MDTAHEATQQRPPVDVTVKYVGEHPFHHPFPPETTFLKVKLAAMKKFDLEADSASKYVLLFGDAEMPDTGVLKDLERRRVELELRLRDEVAKG